ncbi:MAG: NUDIX hydrolase [Alphaproteobacteria bacterium]|jgi:8-oxo-dGTP diphosphatase
MSKIIDKLALVYIKDGKMLMTRTYGKDVFYNPGGVRKEHETDIQALIREIKEELDVNLIPETIKKYGVFTRQAHGKPEGIMVQMTCYTAEFLETPKPTNEIEELAWLDMSDWNKISPVGELIFTDAYKKGLLK